MTALRDEVLRVLTDEADRSPLSAAALRSALRAVGFSPLPSETEVVQALDELMTTGHVEAHHSSRFGRRFRVLRDRGDESGPPSAA